MAGLADPVNENKTKIKANKYLLRFAKGVDSAIGNVPRKESVGAFCFSSRKQQQQ